METTVGKTDQVMTDDELLETVLDDACPGCYCSFYPERKLLSCEMLDKKIVCVRKCRKCGTEWEEIYSITEVSIVK